MIWRCCDATEYKVRGYDGTGVTVVNLLTGLCYPSLGLRDDLFIDHQEVSLWPQQHLWNSDPGPLFHQLLTYSMALTLVYDGAILTISVRPSHRIHARDPHNVARLDQASALPTASTLRGSHIVNTHRPSRCPTWPSTTSTTARTSRITARSRRTSRVCPCAPPWLILRRVRSASGVELGWFGRGVGVKLQESGLSIWWRTRTDWTHTESSDAK